MPSLMMPEYLDLQIGKIRCPSLHELRISTDYGSLDFAQDLVKSAPALRYIYFTHVRTPLEDQAPFFNLGANQRLRRIHFKGSMNWVVQWASNILATLESTSDLSFLGIDPGCTDWPDMEGMTASLDALDALLSGSQFARNSSDKVEVFIGYRSYPQKAWSRPDPSKKLLAEDFLPRAHATGWYDFSLS